MNPADRPDPHELQPGRRRDRPPVIQRSEPAEHPDPHRTWARRSARVSSRRKGFRFVTADYSQIELRILAHMSKDELFARAVPARASMFTGRPPRWCLVSSIDQVTGQDARCGEDHQLRDDLRHWPVRALAEARNISVAEAKTFIEQYFARFPGVRRYLDEQIAHAREARLGRNAERPAALHPGDPQQQLQHARSSASARPPTRPCRAAPRTSSRSR